MGVLYIGSFPPPYGGVTTKNRMLYSAISEKMPMGTVGCRCGFVGKMLLLAKAIVSSSPLVIGLGSNVSLEVVTRLLSLFDKNKMRRSIVFAMGGTLHQYVADRPRFADAICGYSKVYVESKTMADSLRSLGVVNTSVFPNCRVRPAVRKTPEITQAPLRCLYFARICSEKGPEVALEVARRLPDVVMDFWGEFESGEYGEWFLNQMAHLRNCNYRGVFEGDDQRLFQMLSGYDLLVFPSLWKHEGVAGTLIEAKIAGLPAVVFDNNFNAEVVRNSVEGEVVPAGDVDAFIAAVKMLDESRKVLHSEALGAFNSADRYFLDEYLDDICDALGD